jgi:hypothetical protein
MKKTILILGIIFLLVGVSVIPSTGNIVKNISIIKKFYDTNISNMLSEDTICYGYCLNDPSGQLVEGPVCFYLNDPGNITQLWETSSPAPMAGSAWTWGGWYCTEYGSGDLWKIDFDSGYMVEIGGGGVHIDDLTWSEIDKFYGVVNTSFYEVDEYSGEQTFLFSLNLPEGSKIGGINFEYINQMLYGVECVNNGLYIIDWETGYTSFVGPLGIDINGIAILDYSIDDESLYLSTYTDQGELYRIDKNTGDCFLIGEFQGGAEISALTINPDRFYLPTADFYWSPSYPQAGESIEFNASLSDDWNGYIKLYEWDWDDNLIFDENSTDPITSYSWDVEGSYPVTLLVYDDDNGMDTQQYIVDVGNKPPYIPSNIYPSDGELYVDPDADLLWHGGDPNSNDIVTYDIYFGTSSLPPKIVSNQSSTTYDPGTMEYNTQYFWRIVAWDNYNASAEGPIWDFTTEGPNNSPNTPSDPSPYNGGVDVDIDIVLSWEGGDPDPGDTVTYDVYFDDNSPPIKVASNISDTYYNPGILNLSTIYYWQIVARDNHDIVVTGPEWYFSTRVNQPPNIPKITGITNGKPNITYDFTFNTIDPDGDEVRYIIDWDDSNIDTTGFNPSGTDVIVSHSWSETGSYECSVYAEDVYGSVSDETIFTITIKKSKSIQNPILNFLQSHPKLFPILRQLLGL